MNKFRKELNKVVNESSPFLINLAKQNMEHHHPFCRHDRVERAENGSDWYCSCDFLKRYDKWRHNYSS